jgi:hypothetical protein
MLSILRRAGLTPSPTMITAVVLCSSSVTSSPGALPDHFVAGDLVVDTSSRVPPQKTSYVVSNRANETLPSHIPLSDLLEK